MAVSTDRSAITPGTVVWICNPAMKDQHPHIEQYFREATRDEIAMLNPGNTFWIRHGPMGGSRGFMKVEVLRLRCEKIKHTGGCITDETGVFMVDDELPLRAAISVPQ
jgi:hypothetical protein